MADFLRLDPALGALIDAVDEERKESRGTDSGSAYLFDTTTGAQLAKLTASDGESWDEFGRSVGISGSLAIVGSRRGGDNGSDSGAAYLFDVSTPTMPTLLAKLTAGDGAADDYFGWSVAIDGVTIVVSSPNDDDHGSNSGSAYIYTQAEVIPLPAGVWLLGSGYAGPRTPFPHYRDLT